MYPLSVFFYIIRRLSPKKAWVCGLAFGFTLSLFKFFWLMESVTQYGDVPWLLALLPMLILALYLGLYPAIWAALVTRGGPHGNQPGAYGPLCLDAH